MHPSVFSLLFGTLLSSFSDRFRSLLGLFPLFLVVPGSVWFLHREPSSRGSPMQFLPPISRRAEFLTLTPSRWELFPAAVAVVFGPQRFSYVPATTAPQHHSTTGLDDSDAMERQRIGISCSLHFTRSTHRSICLHRDPPESYGDPFYPPPLDIDRNSTVRPVRPGTAAYSITSSSGSLYTP